MEENTKQYQGANASHLWLCVDSDGEDAGGVMLSPCVSEPIPFRNLGDMVLKANQLFDRIDFPPRCPAPRSIVGGPDAVKPEWLECHLRQPASAMELNRQIGAWRRLAPLQAWVHVRYRLNASWQGELHILGSREGISFRSALELMELLAEAVQDSCAYKHIVSIVGG